ncbi:MAG: hypothetical protein WCF65_03410 [Parachlamydiaceae bacterium]
MFKAFFVIILLTLSSAISAAVHVQEKIITIHGFLGASWNMYYLGRVLEAEKMTVSHWSYPSREKKIQAHAEDLVRQLQQEALQNPGRTIHFLTHSMGGLVLRAAINHPGCPSEAKKGKAVLLAPPNQGAFWGRYLGKWAIANFVGKDQAGMELMTELNFEHLGAFPNTMDVLVIAGNQSLNKLIPGENDGSVTVAETYLTTPHRHVVIQAEHHTILFCKDAGNLTKWFFLDP